jgi:hypothetical protein
VLVAGLPVPATVEIAKFLKNKLKGLAKKLAGKAGGKLKACSAAERGANELPALPAVPWNQALRQVGDPVDVVTGAQTFFETDFRLQGDFLPVNFNRHYDSRRNTVDSGMGLGFRLNLAVELCF